MVRRGYEAFDRVDTDELADVEQVAALYVVSGDRITRYAEFPDLAAAFAASAVRETDEITRART